ncbi:ubiquitin carboxyl-terminal hydrolase 37-like [Clupea harengus]|uniref:Ubiquitin carboxyl-terminal hydrolase 37-like n=1 Tax=Clupea harengus TaxID=7950 RepID=A0A8M1KXZ1_CLUHA|nr:ubiquitin carboxyl-terminal hydrolase 37-like [Clupea harengus]
MRFYHSIIHCAELNMGGLTSSPSPCRLPNLGLTCYLNATLQCLFHLQPFCTQLLVQEEVWRMEPEALLLSSFVGLVLLRGSCEMDIKAAVLLELKDQISLHNQEFEGNSQNDAHEFLSECPDAARVIASTGHG